MILRFSKHIRVTLFLIATPFFAHPQPSSSALTHPHPSILLPLARESTFFSFTLHPHTLLHSFDQQEHQHQQQQHPVSSLDVWDFEVVQPLAPWLSFDAASKTFSGTPTHADIGFHKVHLRVFKSTSALSSSSPHSTPTSATVEDSMDISFLVASATGVNAPPEISQIIPISLQIFRQRQQLQQQQQRHDEQQEQEQEQEQAHQPFQKKQQKLHLQRRVDQGGSTATSSGGTSTGKGALPSVFEPYADAEVWEGQSTPLRIQLDPHTFAAAPPSKTTHAAADASSSDEVVSSAGPITYYIKTDGSTTLPSWLKFDTSTLEFSGTPPLGTYKHTTILTITMDASSVPGYTQATDRFTIKVHVHSLGLSTSPLRSCSSSNLYYSQEWDRLWQSYLPDLVLDPQQRHINHQFGTDLFRVDGCSQPARTATAAALSSGAALSSNSSLSLHNSTSNDESLSKPSQLIGYQMPFISRINMVFSEETALELSLPINTLPSWLSFDHINWILSGDLPQDAPSRITLDVHVADSFNTTSVFKLQVFSNSSPFSFIHTVPDVWVKKGESFNIDLLPASLLSYSTEVTVLPVEHKFLFEPVDTTRSQVDLTTSSNTTITRLGKNPINPLLNATPGNHTSTCTYTDLWGQQGENNREAGSSPLIPNWFNRTSFTSNLPVPSSPTTPSSQEGKVELQGHISCEMILRVRWIVRNSLGQLASTEFMIWANDQGPPQAVKPHVDEASGQHHGSVGPIGVKIAVGIAVATPVLIAIWFMITRYCRRLRRQDGSIKPTMGSDLERGRARPMSGSDEHARSGLDSRIQRRRQPTSEVLPNGEPEYRSSYEDDPSVGHHDSYSEKYVAEHGPHIYTTTSGDEGEGSGSSKRTSILGWIFGDRNPGEEDLSAIAVAEMNRRRMSEPLTFSLKRISVGYPFESNRFGFVNGNRISLYDSGAGTSTNASSPAAPSQENNSTEPGEVASGTNPSSKPPSESAPKKLSNRSSSIFKKGTKRLSKLIKDKEAIDDKATKRDAAIAARHLGLDSSYQTVRPCHSFLSTGTGYMASMSECNTSIEERQDSGRNSDDETEEDRRVDRSNADPESQKPWTPSAFLMMPKGLRPNRDVEFVGGSEESEPEYRGLSEGIHRSDSGALMTGSSSMAFSEPLKETTRNAKTPPSIKTSFQDLSRSSSAPPPPLSYSSSLKVPGVESDSSASLSSARTAPVTGPEVLFAKERQSSISSVTSSFQRRSIVEFLQSNDDPVSPLTALSASLPSWSHVAESSSSQSRGQGRGTSKNGALSSSQEDSTSDENRDSIYSIGKEVPHEITKWMVVPSSQTFRSVSLRKGNKDQKETSEWISDSACESEKVGNTVKGVDRNQDEYDERHRSLPYELGTVLPLPSCEGVSQSSSSMATSTPSPMRPPPVLSPIITTTSQPPRSAPAHSPTLSHGFTYIPSIHAQLPLTRHSMDRMRPVSYPILTTAPVVNAVIPRRFVKATIGSAFHSTSSIRDPMSSSPSSPRLLAQQTSFSRAMSPPPMSPPLLPSSPPPMSPRSSIYFGDEAAAPLPGEFRAYLVSDPQDQAQAQEQQQQRGHHHRPSASLSSIDVERLDVGRPKRKLPEWIQFNSKMRSLWGRPVPGTAGEWQVSMVQTQLVPSSTLSSSAATAVATAGSVSPSSSASVSAAVVTGGEHHHPTLGQQDLPLESAVEDEQKKEVEGEGGKGLLVEGMEGMQTQDVEMELVVLLVREPGEAPLSPLLGATRSRTFPSLAQTQSQDHAHDQAQVQSPAQVQVQDQIQAQLPALSVLSLTSSQTAPSLTIPDSQASLVNQSLALSPTTPVVDMVATVEHKKIVKSAAPISPVSPLPNGASAAISASSCASPLPCLQQQYSPTPSQIKPVSTTSPSCPNPSLSSNASLSSSPSPRPSPGSGPGRAVGQRVLAERRRIEALMRSQQGL